MFTNLAIERGPHIVDSVRCHKKKLFFLNLGDAGLWKQKQKILDRFNLDV